MADRFTDPIVFSQDDLRRIEVQVMLGDVEYVLRETDGAAITERDNALTNGTTYNSDGKPERIIGVGAIDSVMLARCLFYRQSNKAVTVQFVNGLPDRVRKMLIDRLKQISGLDDEEEKDDGKEDPLGNSSTVTGDGSV